MHPLLISGLSSVASGALEGLQRALAPRASAPDEAQFSSALKQAQTATAAPRSASREELIDALRGRLLEAPELRTELDAADPAKMPSLTVTPDGAVSVQTSDGRTHALSLSPETAAAARELGAMLPGPAPLTLARVSASLRMPVTVRQ